MKLLGSFEMIYETLFQCSFQEYHTFTHTRAKHDSLTQVMNGMFFFIEYLAFPFFPLLLDLWRPFRELRPFLDPLWQEPWWRKLIPCPHPSKQQDPFYFLPQPSSSLHRFKITGGKNGPDTKIFREIHDQVQIFCILQMFSCQDRPSCR